MARAPFSPTVGQAVTISASTSSANEDIITGQHQLRISNAGSVVAFVRSGRGTQTATTDDLPVLPGESIIITMSSDHSNVAAITATGTATVYAIPGNGGI